MHVNTQSTGSLRSTHPCRDSAGEGGEPDTTLHCSRVQESFLNKDVCGHGAVSSNSLRTDLFTSLVTGQLTSLRD